MEYPLISLNLLLHQPGFYLKPCLDSILAQVYKKFELVIIDNNSSDGTVGLLKDILKQAQGDGQALPPCKILANQENFGFAAGHNLGIRASQGKLVFLLNQDIILEKDFVRTIVELFSRDEKIGSVQGKLLRLKVEGDSLSKSETIDTTGLVIFKNRRIIARGQGQTDRGQFNLIGEIFGVDGAAPAFRRQALEDTKICLGENCEYLDEDFYMYKEDVDLAWRLRLAGWKAYYEPRATAWHARTAGDSAARNYLGILRERLKINQSAKYFSFKNQRLMQMKNERFGMLLKHLFWFLPKEVASWIYVVLFERYTLKAIRDLFKQAPGAWQKRKIIMARRRATNKEIKRWFE